ncbi:MAG: hypothetical protein BWX88_02048 [Planctomycetes bacterium ADurb.Bin126]|nr:MAG: hypothetical protein BWX88_02048 [Planctomycetes bacterium ADurb.Bin126]HQL71926.1 hypothetical protein [Phycisphaerae bacterium]
MKHAWALAAVVMLAGMLVGCPEYRIIWAPDGTKALVAGKDQLYLCDADGKLQPLAAVPRGPMAWTADSRQFVIRREIPVKNWEELAAGLPADQLAYLKRMSEDWMDHLRKTPDARVYRGRLGALMALYLSAHHNEEITRIAQGDWRGKQKVSPTVDELTLCTFADRKLGMTPICRSAIPIIRAKLAPDDKSLAFTADFEYPRGTSLRLYAASLRSGSVPTLLESAAGGFDWLPSRPSLLLAASRRGGEEGTIQLCERDSTPPATAPVEDPHEGNPAGKTLNHVMFEREAGIAAFADGRVLFSSGIVPSPSTDTDDFFLPRLFLQRIDLQSHLPSSQATIVVKQDKKGPFEKGLHYFSASPDGRYVVIPTENGTLLMQELETSASVWIRVAEGEVNYTLPVWKDKDTFCFVAPERSVFASPNRAEVVLITVGKRCGWLPWIATWSCRVISRDWPDGLMKELDE